MMSNALRSRRRVLAAAWVAVFLLSAAGSRAVRAQGADPDVPAPLLVKDFLLDLDRGIKTGPLTLHAYLTEHVAFNDNLLLAESAKTSDFLFDTMAGARVDLRYGTTKGRLFVEGETIYTLATPSYNHMNFNAQLDCAFKGSAWFLEVREQFRYLGQAENLYHTALGNFLTYLVNDAGVQAGFQLARFGFEVGAGLAFWLFSDKPLEYLNHTEIPLTARVSYAWRKLKVYVSGDYGMVDFVSETVDGAGRVYRLNDYDTFGGGIGLNYEISGKLQLHLSAGLRVQDVSDSGTITDTSSYTGFVANLNLNYRMTHKVTLGATYTRALEFSGSSNYQTTDSLSAFYRHEILPRFTVKLSPRFGLVAPSAEDSFVLVAAYVLLDYRLWEWFHGGLRYDFRMRTTARDGGSYMNHVVALTLTAYF